MKRVIITGANGFLGSALAAHLAKRSDYHVIASVRRADAPLPAGTEPLVAPFEQVDAWRAAMSGIDVVVHVAARVHLLQDDSTDPLLEYRRDNVAASVALAQAAADAGVRRFVFISSIHVNGRETIDERFDESMQPRIETPYAQSKLEAEQELRSIADRTGIELVIIRPPLVYGEGVAGNFARLLKLVASGMPIPLGAVRNQRSAIARENLVDFITLCLDHPRAANELFVVSDGMDLSTPELIRALARGMNRRAVLLPVPVSILRSAAGLIGRAEEFRQLCGSLAVNSSKAQTMLGWQPPLSAEAAMMAAGTNFINRRNRAKASSQT